MVKGQTMYIAAFLIIDRGSPGNDHACVVTHQRDSQPLLQLPHSFTLHLAHGPAHLLPKLCDGRERLERSWPTGETMNFNVFWLLDGTDD